MGGDRKTKGVVVVVYHKKEPLSLSGPQKQRMPDSDLANGVRLYLDLSSSIGHSGAEGRRGERKRKTGVTMVIRPGGWIDVRIPSQAASTSASRRHLYRKSAMVSHGRVLVWPVLPPVCRKS